jgi:hypothetical protein
MLLKKAHFVVGSIADGFGAKLSAVPLQHPVFLHGVLHSSPTCWAGMMPLQEEDRWPRLYIHGMKPSMIHLSAIFLSMLISASASAQITLVQNLTPQQLVEQYLIGPGVSVSNVTFNGQPGSVANS